MLHVGANTDTRDEGPFAKPGGCLSWYMWKRFDRRPSLAPRGSTAIASASSGDGDRVRLVTRGRLQLDGPLSLDRRGGRKNRHKQFVIERLDRQRPTAGGRLLGRADQSPFMFELRPAVAPSGAWLMRRTSP